MGSGRNLAGKHLMMIQPECGEWTGWRERGQGKNHLACSAHHEQDGQAFTRLIQPLAINDDQTYSKVQNNHHRGC